MTPQRARAAAAAHAFVAAAARHIDAMDTWYAEQSPENLIRLIDAVIEVDQARETKREAFAAYRAHLSDIRHHTSRRHRARRPR